MQQNLMFTFKTQEKVVKIFKKVLRDNKQKKCELTALKTFVAKA